MQTTASMLDALDWAHHELIESPERAPAAIGRLNEELNALRASLPNDQWQELVLRCREHAVLSLILEDPLTRRSYTKPRGYPGDAELLDIIYERDWSVAYPEAPTALGATIFKHTIECQAPAAVRHRRVLLAGMIDEVSTTRRDAAIMSVACGHLRELPLSSAMQFGRVGQFVGLDQDADSLAVVARDWPDRRVETVTGSIKALWGPVLRDQRFDFIYTAGLYDYLDEKLAQKMTERMFDMLCPGGRLLVANYQPGIADVGYMEAFMDWNLIYRDRPAMERLTAGLPEQDVAAQEIFSDPSEAVFYLQLERRA